jgi:hypothetical protein
VAAANLGNGQIAKQRRHWGDTLRRDGGQHDSKTDDGDGSCRYNDWFDGLVGFAGNEAFAADTEDVSQEALIKRLDPAKINLQQALAASEQEGQPISAKFEVDDGKLQLSIYAAKDGKFSEVLVDYVTGKIVKAEPISGGDDLTAAHEQNAAMANAQTSLQAAVDKTIAQSANTRAVSVAPSMKDGHPIASIDVLTYNQIKTIQQPLD